MVTSPASLVKLRVSRNLSKRNRVGGVQIRTWGPAVDILLAEDHDPDVYLTISAFRDAKVKNQIHVVTDGAAAIAFLRRSGIYSQAPRPDLVLLDLNLPKLDGFQVLAEMKADRNLKTIPVVVVSGSNRKVDRERAYDLQASAYLVKSMDLDEYFTAIRSLKQLWFHTLSFSPKEPDESAS